MRRKILGCPVDDLDLGELVNIVRYNLERGYRQWYTSMNVANWYAYTHFPDVASLIDEANIITADGWPIAWAGRAVYGEPFPRIPAMNFLDTILSNLPDNEPVRVFLLGGKPGVAERAGPKLEARYPRIRVVGTFHGFLENSGAEQNAVDAINKARPTILILGMGTPYEQRWLVRHFDESPALFAIGIGGGIDILAGLKTRAPAWMQKYGMEWLYRMLQEPQRLSGRYFVTSLSFAWHVVQTVWTMNPEGRPESHSNKKEA